jgi:hypothetical protein
MPRIIHSDHETATSDENLDRYAANTFLHQPVHRPIKQKKDYTYVNPAGFDHVRLSAPCAPISTADNVTVPRHCLTEINRVDSRIAHGAEKSRLAKRPQVYERIDLR